MISSFARSVWPVKKIDLPLFLPLLGFYLSVLFNQTIINITKNNLAITYLDIETILSIQLWLELPFSIAFAQFNRWLQRRLGTRRYFIFALLPFVLYIPLFSFVLHTALSASSLQYAVCFYYILSSSWIQIGLSLTFWPLAHRYTAPSKALPFFTTFTQFGSLGLMLSGGCSSLLSAFLEHGNVENFLQVLMKAQATLFLAAVGLMLFCFRLILGKRAEGCDKPAAKESHQKVSLSMMWKHTPLRNLGFIIVSFMAVMNLFDLLFTHLASKGVEDPAGLNALVSKLSMLCGALSFVISNLARFFLKKWGWLPVALLPPLIVLALEHHI